MNVVLRGKRRKQQTVVPLGDCSRPTHSSSLSGLVTESFPLQQRCPQKVKTKLTNKTTHSRGLNPAK